jgi:hypothetical protein
MYRHSVAFWVKRTVMIKEHQLHFFLSVQSLLSHVYTESVLYKEILKRHSVSSAKSSFSSSRSILLWIFSLLKQWEMISVVSELLNTAFVWLIFCLSIHSHLLEICDFTEQILILYKYRYWYIHYCHWGSLYRLAHHLKCIICIIQCCISYHLRDLLTYLALTSWQSICFSFWFSDKYSMKKLYCDSI